MALDRVKFEIKFNTFGRCWGLTSGVCALCLSGMARHICAACRGECHRYAKCRTLYDTGVCGLCLEEVLHGP